MKKKKILSFLLAGVMIGQTVPIGRDVNGRRRAVIG